MEQGSFYYTMDMDWECERAEMQIKPRLLAGMTSPEHQTPEYPTIPLGFCRLVASRSTGRALGTESPLEKKGQRQKSAVQVISYGANLCPILEISRLVGQL